MNKWFEIYKGWDGYGSKPWRRPEKFPNIWSAWYWQIPGVFVGKSGK